MELYVKQELMKTLPVVDAIILDIDGVVLNVAETFRVVTAEIVQLVLGEMVVQKEICWRREQLSLAWKKPIL